MKPLDTSNAACIGARPKRRRILHGLTNSPHCHCSKEKSIGYE
jgi:hypothetical protein